MGLYQRQFGGREFHILSCWFAKPMYRYKLFLYCTSTSRIVRKMALMTNQHDRIWKGGGTQPLIQKSSARWPHSLISSLLSYLKMALMYKKLPMGGIVYIPGIFEMFWYWALQNFKMAAKNRRSKFNYNYYY